MQFLANNKKIISKISFVLLAILIFFLHQLIFLSYLNIGSFHFDWQSILSRLTVGKIWFLKNGLSIPWFSPHICCGAPYYSNPQSEFYSPIQFIFLFLKPLTTIKITFTLYSLCAFVGTLLLLRKIFKLSYYSSLIGGTIFLFNNYFAFHFLSGHHSWGLFALVPMFFYVSALSLDKIQKKYELLFYVFVSSLIFALMMHSGGTRIILEILISVFFITLIHLIYKKNLKIIYIISTSVLIGLMISSSKIYAAYSFIENISRDVEPIYFNSIISFFNFFIQSFFLFPDKNLTVDVANVIGRLNVEELTFNVSIIPIIIFIIFIVKISHTKKQIKFVTNKLYFLFWFILILSIIILIIINFQNTFLGSLISRIPFLTTDWITIRLLAPLILIFTISSAILFEKISFKRMKLVTIVFTAIIISQNLFFDRNQLYKIFSQNYFGKVLNANITKDNIENYKIDKVFSILDKDSKYIGPNPHFFFLDNKSMQFCYFSIFGYDLEALKPIVKNLVFSDRKDEYVLENNAKLSETWKGRKVYFFEGDPLLEVGKNLNFINPSCYLNPEDNNCEKDFFFKIEDKQKLENFLNYKPFDFKQLKVQILFNYLSLIFLIVCAVYIILYLGLKIKKPLLKI